MSKIRKPVEEIVAVCVAAAAAGLARGIVHAVVTNAFSHNNKES
jgi:hypothetical protein